MLATKPDSPKPSLGTSSVPADLCQTVRVLRLHGDNYQENALSSRACPPPWSTCRKNDRLGPHASGHPAAVRADSTWAAGLLTFSPHRVQEIATYAGHSRRSRAAAAHNKTVDVYTLSPQPSFGIQDTSRAAHPPRVTAAPYAGLLSANFDQLAHNLLGRRKAAATLMRWTFPVAVLGI